MDERLTHLQQTSGKSVTVIGGGVAGMSAACALAEAGLRVQLVERRGYLGGRASSYLHPGVEEVIDNCQHVLFGCCTNLIGFYRRIGVAGPHPLDHRDDHDRAWRAVLAPGSIVAPGSSAQRAKFFQRARLHLCRQTCSGPRIFGSDAAAAGWGRESKPGRVAQAQGPNRRRCSTASGAW